MAEVDVWDLPLAGTPRYAGGSRLRSSQEMAVTSAFILGYNVASCCWHAEQRLSFPACRDRRCCHPSKVEASTPVLLSTCCRNCRATDTSGLQAPSRGSSSHCA